MRKKIPKNGLVNIKTKRKTRIFKWQSAKVQFLPKKISFSPLYEREMFYEIKLSPLTHFEQRKRRIITKIN